MLLCFNIAFLSRIVLDIQNGTGEWRGQICDAAYPFVCRRDCTSEVETDAPTPVSVPTEPKDTRSLSLELFLGSAGTIILVVLLLVCQERT